MRGDFLTNVRTNLIGGKRLDRFGIHNLQKVELDRCSASQAVFGDEIAVFRGHDDNGRICLFGKIERAALKLQKLTRLDRKSVV